MDWEAIIWFVIWAVVILAGAALLIWASIAAIAVTTMRRAQKEVAKGFDSEFFRSPRRRV